MAYVSNFDKVKLLVLIEKRNGLTQAEVNDELLPVVQACTELGWIAAEILPGWRAGVNGFVLTSAGEETLVGFRALLAPLD